MVARLDDGVAQVCGAYLELADRHAPGLVEGLYLQGSVALADYRPGISDIGRRGCAAARAASSG